MGEKDKSAETRIGQERRTGDRRVKQVTEWGFPDRRAADRRSGLDRREKP